MEFTVTKFDEWCPNCESDNLWTGQEVELEQLAQDNCIIARWDNLTGEKAVRISGAG